MSLPQPSESFAWTQEPWGPALQCLPLLAVAPHLFTSGAVSVSRDAGDPALSAVAASLGLTANAIIQVHQVHGREVVVVKGDSAPSPALSLSADALVTDSPHHAIAVRVADCVPILLANRAGTVVTAVHAGWRGTAAGVVQAAVGVLREGFDVPAGDLLAALGPSIRACCYEVGPELPDAFRQAGLADTSFRAWFSPGKRDRLQLDIPRANRDQLRGLDVPDSQIFDSGLCTACHSDVFHSYRRTGNTSGRALAAIRVRRKR